MARHNHPAKSFLLFVAICAAAWFGWQNRHLLKGSKAELLTAEQRMEMRDAVIERYQGNEDFITLRAISWRPNEQRYRVDIEIEDACENPRGLCHDIAAFIEDHSDVSATVIAVDVAGRELGRAVL